MAEVDAYQIALAMVRQLNAEEVDDLPPLWRYYLAGKSLTDVERLLGSGLGSSLTDWAPLVVTFLGTEGLFRAAVDSANDGIRRKSFALWRRARCRFRRQRRPALISFDERQIDVIADRARSAALAAKRTPLEANEFAKALVAALERGTDG